MPMQRVKIGSLDCTVVDETQGNPQALVILCHGYGAPGDDLVGLAPELLQQRRDLADKVQFIFPAAPILLENVPFGGRAWWHIDVMRYQKALMTGSTDKLAEETPTGLAEARRALRFLLDTVTAQTKLPYRKIVIGGFSQGSMLATDVTLHLDEATAGLCIFSGAPIDINTWKLLVTKRKGLPVFQAHGTQDPVLAYGLGLSLGKLLQDGGMHVSAVSFRGGHTIPSAALGGLAALIDGALGNTATQTTASASR